MLVPSEEKTVCETEKNGFNSTNSYHQLNDDHLSSEVIAKDIDKLCVNMMGFYHQNEQTNAEKISKISVGMLNKTTGVFYEIEQINDEKIKQMIESHIGKSVSEDKFEKIDHEMQRSDLAPSIQTNAEKDQV